MDDDFYILGIESSCDDTSVAITNKNHVLSNIISSQLVHNQYGGVVPEIASREHMKNIVPVLKNALEVSKIDLNEIDLIAYTNGCLLYTSPSPRDFQVSRMPSSA